MKKTYLITLLLLFCGMMQLQAQQIMPPHINVSGTGEVKLKPDEVVLSFGFEVRDKSLEKARKQVDSQSSSVISYLKKQGIDERLIQTSYVSVYPMYQGGEFANAAPEFYMAQKTMTVVVKQLNKYDELVAGLYKAGVNRVDGVSFRVSELEKHKAEAQKRAVNNARQKAQALANELGSKTGRVYAINETSGSNNPSPVYAKSLRMEADMAGDGPSIAGGEVLVTSSVQVTFLLE
ncbi:SIMPL domain-containing protein [Pontibacter sp. SGAir0037]|uniref:SIMPL domain-containing protein n=1 Tax=Pontibacter sp. SGAir0037 TaxID=2571030 RepID=UPI0010CCB552|nr:SIMPL domain-containing protein [Pontibacter sp. SGAir0037]QCR22773.1 SIMPL domain-containing protein [Pontibacter sp. SGAir0037]